MYSAGAGSKWANTPPGSLRVEATIAPFRQQQTLHGGAANLVKSFTFAHGHEVSPENRCITFQGGVLQLNSHVCLQEVLDVRDEERCYGPRSGKNREVAEAQPASDFRGYRFSSLPIADPHGRTLSVMVDKNPRTFTVASLSSNGDAHVTDPIKAIQDILGK